MIVHIVPTVPPDLNGLGDYCFKLSHNWPDVEVRWGCATLRLPDKAKESWPDATFSTFEPSEQGLKVALDMFLADTLILHYVNYAYHPKGRPTWLPAALTQWKKDHPQARVIVMFHELWAVEPPWRRSFWIMATARSIVRQLALLSDGWVTSSQLYFDHVVAVGGEAFKGAVIPIATNIEAAAPIDFQRPWPLFSGGKLKVAVFGLASTRNAALSMHSALLSQLCAQGLVERISMLGQKPQNEKENAALEAIIAKIGHEKLWQHAYDLSPVEASTLLAEHDLGIVKETVVILTKSGVFAALCSHGVVPICSNSESESETSDSAFIINTITEQTIDELQNESIIATKKLNIEKLAKTSLTWPSVAARWKRHIEQPQ